MLINTYTKDSTRLSLSRRYFFPFICFGNFSSRQSLFPCAAGTEIISFVSWHRKKMLAFGLKRHFNLIVYRSCIEHVSFFYRCFSLYFPSLTVLRLLSYSSSRSLSLSRSFSLQLFSVCLSPPSPFHSFSRSLYFEKKSFTGSHEIHYYRWKESHHCHHQLQTDKKGINWAGTFISQTLWEKNSVHRKIHTLSFLILT